MKLNRSEYKFYQAISRATQEELILWAETYLTNLYTEERVIATEDFVYAVGDIPVMLVAHLDTVHNFAPVDMFYDREMNVIWSPQGLGADDRAGVYAILQIALSGLRPHILFTTDEEIGGLGAQTAAKQLVPDVNFVIELDRRGTEDSVFYDCDNPEFETYVNQYGFKTAYGSFSDISYLCPEWKVAGVNLSIGYENEHTKSESLDVSAMNETIRKVKDLLENVDAEKDKFEYIESVDSYGSNYYSFLRGWKKDPKKAAFGYTDTDVDLKTPEICYECFNGVPSDLIIHNAHGKFCGDCYAKVFTTCVTCQDEFKDKTKSHLQCEKCRKEA
jgi:hypothetical protein